MCAPITPEMMAGLAAKKAAGLPAPPKKEPPETLAEAVARRNEERGFNDEV